MKHRLCTSHVMMLGRNQRTFLQYSALHTIHCTLHTVYYTLYTKPFTLHTTHNDFNPTLLTEHSTQCTQQAALKILDTATSYQADFPMARGGHRPTTLKSVLLLMIQLRGHIMTRCTSATDTTDTLCYKRN